jgi:hypothetical protein
MVEAQSKAASVATLPPGAREGAAHAAQRQAASATSQAQRAASIAAGEVSGAIAALPRFGPAAGARRATSHESGTNLMEVIDRLNKLLAYPLAPAAVAALSFEANAVYQVWQAGNALAALPGLEQTWFDELVSPVGLSFDRGEVGLGAFIAPLDRWASRVGTANAFAMQGWETAVKSAASGGLPDGGTGGIAGKVLTVANVAADALLEINPGAHGVHGVVTRVVAGVNGLTTLASASGSLGTVAGLDSSLGWVPYAGQALIIGSGLYLAYDGFKPLHDFVNGAASGVASVATGAFNDVTNIGGDAIGAGGNVIGGAASGVASVASGAWNDVFGS